MSDAQPGAVAVIFTSVRNGSDPDGYAAAAEAMARRAANQPGFLSMESARGADGTGITVSLWADEAAAIAWRDDPVHSAIRKAGRDRWYDRYDVVVAHVGRRYVWSRATGERT